MIDQRKGRVVYSRQPTEAEDDAMSYMRNEFGRFPAKDAGNKDSGADNIV